MAIHEGGCLCGAARYQSMADHLRALDRHVGPGLVRTLLLNATPIAPERLRPYREQSGELVRLGGLDERPETVIEAPLVTDSGKIRHDPALLAQVLVGMASARPAGASRVSRGASTT